MGTVSGTVESGTGEGRYYVRKYNEYFKETVGFSCYPGTLNLRIASVSLPEKSFLIHPGNGFKDVKCYPVVINGKQNGAVVIPCMARDRTVLEIIAPENLRKTLTLKDGDKVTVSFI